MRTNLKEVQEAVKDYEDSKLENPGNQQPKFSDVIKTDLGGNPTSDPNWMPSSMATT